MTPWVACFRQHGPLCHADDLVLQNFDEAPLAAVTASSLLGYKVISVAHLWGCFAILCRSFQAQPAWMETNSGETFSFFWSCQTCLMGLSQDSGWGHSRTSLELSLSCFCVVLAMCLLVWRLRLCFIPIWIWELRPTCSVLVPSDQRILFITIWVLWV